MNRNINALTAFVCACCVVLPTGFASAQQVVTEIPAGAYVTDKSHTTVLFRVNHIGFSKYTASFSGVDATLELDPDKPEEASLAVKIEAASLTLTAPPDGFAEMLLGPAWLDAAAYPDIEYRSTTIEKTGDKTARVTGDLTLKGKTMPVVLDVTFNGGYGGMEVYDPNARIGFSAEGVLKRSEFGIDVGVPPEGTNFGVSDEVEIIIETEFSGPPLKLPE